MVTQGPTTSAHTRPSITDVPSGQVVQDNSPIVEGLTATAPTGPHITTVQRMTYENGYGYSYKNGKFEGTFQ